MSGKTPHSWVPKLVFKYINFTVKAVKTRNLYKLSVAEYKKLLDQNIITDYKKVTVTKLNNVNKEAAEIALDLDIDDKAWTSQRSQRIIPAQEE